MNYNQVGSPQNEEREPFVERIEIWSDNNSYIWELRDDHGWVVARTMYTFTDLKECEADAKYFKERVAAAQIVYAGEDPDLEL